MVSALGGGVLISAMCLYMQLNIGVRSACQSGQQAAERTILFGGKT